MLHDMDLQQLVSLISLRNEAEGKEIKKIPDAGRAKECLVTGEMQHTHQSEVLEKTLYAG